VVLGCLARVSLELWIGELLCLAGAAVLPACLLAPGWDWWLAALLRCFSRHHLQRAPQTTVLYLFRGELSGLAGVVSVLSTRLVIKYHKSSCVLWCTLPSTPTRTHDISQTFAKKKKWDHPKIFVGFIIYFVNFGGDSSSKLTSFGLGGRGLLF
jgi:hypothetical protein